MTQARLKDPSGESKCAKLPPFSEHVIPPQSQSKQT